MNYNIAGRTAKYCWLAAIVWVIVLNIQPYIEIIYKLTSGIIIVPLADLLEPLPLVGPALTLIAIALPSIAAIAVYGLIQLLQCLPMMLASPQVVRARIAAGEQWQHLSIRQSDPGWLRELKEKLNSFPLEWIDSIHTGSKLAYAVDAVLSGLQYPLFKAGWMDAIQNWNTLGLSDVQWSSLPGFLTMVFALEGVVWLYLKLAEGISIFNGPVAATTTGKNPQPNEQPMSW